MQRVVAVAGLPGSGKTTVAKIIESYGYSYYSLGDVVRAEAQRVGTSPDKAAVVLRLEKGRRAVARGLLENMKTSAKIVIDGLRSLEETEALEEVFSHVFLIYVVASRRTRYMRLIGRGRGDDPVTFSHFLMRDIRELRFGLADLLARADYVLVNEDKSIEELQREISKLL